MRFRGILGLASAAAGAAIWLAATPAHAADAAPSAVAVSGEGMVATAPDIAIVTTGVVTRAGAAGAALKANAAAMTKVLAAIRAAGIEERDVGTSGLSVQPQYDYGDGGTPQAPKLVGYEVRNVVTVRSRAVDRLGELIDSLVQAGSNQIEGLAFDVSDREARLDEARRAAIADARRKAALYAEAAGARLGGVLSIEEDPSADEPVRPFAGRAKALQAAAPATPIARGEQELRARVTVRWRLEG
ncbi:SIMPL domain-containing protein [Hansschlegelia zhihuaiae]|uniref:DUF541 domain-containing protein n=1 Tax=Hansschlegelia zhihuaiae TaxID=405005 RepID=A0A4Q0MN71_9HYPH|nr:SIMPL domain-containing protein [Hansschlegelia zhihuaiae]RXF75301.1 DUF541 domain-containing protein [Hansschlegelia zhihuaiae]